MEQIITWIRETVAFVLLLIMGQLRTWITTVSRWCSGTNVPNVDESQGTNLPEQNSEAVTSAKSPDEYLDRATQCMERVREMTSRTISSGDVTLNDSQCKYLAVKLERAIQASSEPYWSAPPEHKLSYLEILRLLYQLAKEVESFINNCCKDKWMETGLTSATSVPERVSSLAYYLEVCTVLLRNTDNLGAGWLTFTNLESLREAELDAVKERASTDVVTLLTTLESLALPSNVSTDRKAVQHQRPSLSEGLCKAELRGVGRDAKPPPSAWKSPPAFTRYDGIELPDFLLPLDLKLQRLREVSCGRALSRVLDPRQIQLATILHKRLKAIRAMSTSCSLQWLHLEDWKVDEEGLTRLEKLGEGGCAEVYKAKWLGAVEVAEKVFPVPSNVTFTKEVSLLAKMSHPHIVSFLGYCTYKDSCSIVTEVMDGDLQHHMEKLMRNKTRAAPFSILVACDTMLQVAEGVNYVHQNEVVHRDLKSANVLVRWSSDNEVEYVCAKLADFGLSKTKERSIAYSNQTSNTGSTRWMAPEVIKYKEQRKRKEGPALPYKGDVYSFGMLCYEILTGDIPFSTISNPREVKEEVLAGRRPPLPRQCPKDLKSLIEMCWNEEPSARPSFPQICEELRYLKCSLLMEHLTKPAWYLDLATTCMQLVRQMTSGSDFQRVKWNPSQCKYLAGKLETTVDACREHYMCLWSPEYGLAEVAAYRRTLLFLCRLATEVETFIRECCQDKCHTSVTSVPGHVSSWGYYLELCTVFLRNRNNLEAASLTAAGLESLRKAELDALKKIASFDEETLLKTLESLTLANKSKTRDHQFQLATILLERLKAVQAMSTLGSPLSTQLPIFEIDPSALRPTKTLGRGSISTVYKSVWLGQEVAISTQFYDEMHVRSFKEEVSFLAGLHHPNIVNIFGYVNKEKQRGEEECSIVMELMDQDLSYTMEQRLRDGSRNEGPFNIDEAVDLMLQVAEGVNYLHENGIVHRDLKSSNILVKYAKATKMKMVQDFLSVKVSDFGFSNSKMELSSAGHTPPMARNMLVARWMAPELIRFGGGQASQRLKYPFKTDVYSFSMLCYEILTGNAPFFTARPREVTEMVLSGRRPQLPHQCPLALKTLIQRCWDPAPSGRPSFTEICEELRYLKCISLLPEPSSRIRRYQAAQPIARMAFDLPELTEAAEPSATALDVPELTEAAQPIAKAFDLSGLSLTKVEYSCLNRGMQLGKGGLETTVYKTTYRPTQVLKDHVAEKRFVGAYNEEFKNEITILADLKHSNIVPLIGYAMDTIRSRCSIVMELMDRDLSDLMRGRMSELKSTTPTDEGPFFIDEAVDIMLQIAQGMDSVHQKKVVHRDLKSKNILVWSKNKVNHFHVKVSDFGLSKRMKPGSYLRFNIGTPNWMAPEVMRLENNEDMHVGMSTRRTPVSSTFLYFSNAMGKIPLMSEKKIKNYPDPLKSDIYSFGIVCFEILTGNVPTFHLKNRSEQISFEQVFKNNLQNAAAIFLLFLYLERLKSKDPQRQAVVLLLLEGLSFKKDPQKAIVVLLLLHLKFKKDPSEVLKEKVRAGHRPLLPDYCPPKLKALIERCWDADPSARPSFAQIIVDLKHVLR